MLVICCTLTMALHGIVKILQGPNLYLYSVTARESQAISGWLRFHTQVTKNREITTFIFSVQASIVPFLSSCTAPAASFNIDLYLYFTWKKIEDRNLEITLKKGQSTDC